MTETAPKLCHIAPIGALCASIIALPSPTSACLTPPVYEYDGAPADGDVGVPTNVVLTVNASRLGALSLDSTAIRLETTSGNAVDVAVEHTYQWSYTLSPQQELSPNTEYTVKTSSPDGPVEMIRFTTGTGPVDTPPEPPVAALEHYRLVNGSATSCSPHSSGSCVVLPDSAWVWARLISPFGTDDPGYLYHGAFSTN